MMPVLLELGSVRVGTWSSFVLAASVVALYWWWKMGRDEHWEETGLFDAYFAALGVFWLAGKVGYVLFRGEHDGVWQSLLGLVSPGFAYEWGLAGAVLAVSLVARGKGWEIWKVWDALAVAVALAVAIGSVGWLLAQGQLPLDLVRLVWALVSFAVVSRVRRDFRFYQWYKGEASVARDGLAALVWLAGLAVWWLGEAVGRGSWPAALGAGGLLATWASLVYLRSGQDKTKMLKWFKRSKSDVS